MFKSRIRQIDTMPSMKHSFNDEISTKKVADHYRQDSNNY